MSKVKIGLRTVFGNVTFSVFVGIQCTRINVDVWIKLLDGSAIATGLKKFGK